MPKKLRKRLMYIFTNEGQNLVSEHDFLRIMHYWAAFSANDINLDNELDSREVKMLMWLLNNKKPSKSLIEREVRIMDADQSGTVNRIEWVAYLSAPSVSMYHLGNMAYYDFPMRELFEEIDDNGDGSIDFSELVYFICQDLGSSYLDLSDSRQVEAQIHIKFLAKECIEALKKLAKEAPSIYVAPNLDPISLTWVEFQRYRKVCKMQKLELSTLLAVLMHQQK